MVTHRPDEIKTSDKPDNIAQASQPARNALRDQSQRGKSRLLLHLLYAQNSRRHYHLDQGPVCVLFCRPGQQYISSVSDTPGI
ncbi:hypothetical protein BGW36DRAFT_366443 [Talaromyces proteolyticus]|uniref:Uncharacterized protein n=1 Tax=Talaromyces proteolyticus TaxID=1131652 RepID=A0AAD4KZT4_9EURO|nr:uncharacterized protein BGW36DRAFT_366443 [Talaromyces proteolyticus]KAH8704928.1 hypothetical protein BGW36DRAFT_366443 [Talaromyces proteolyticus]